MATKLDHVIEFYGETCPHCQAMRPVVEQLEKELSGEIAKREVWNNQANKEFMSKYEDQIGQACGGLVGVPSFINTQTHQALCGEQSLDNLKLLAEGGDCRDGVCMPHSKMPSANQA